MIIYITYELWNPLNNQIFYVGAGYPNRPQIHLDEFYKTRKGGWTGRKSYNRAKYETIKEIINAENNVDIRIVLETDCRDDAFRLEIELIQQYGRMDLGLGPLTNLTDGGDGGDWTKGKDSEEVAAVYKKRGNQTDGFKGAQKWFNSLSDKEKKEWYRAQAEKRTFDWYVSRKDDGEEFLIHNLHEWCKENDVDSGRASIISNPKHKEYGNSAKGWRIRRADRSPLVPFVDRRYETHPNHGWAKGKNWRIKNGKRVYY